MGRSGQLTRAWASTCAALNAQACDVVGRRARTFPQQHAVHGRAALPIDPPPHAHAAGVRHGQRAAGGRLPLHVMHAVLHLWREYRRGLHTSQQCCGGYYMPRARAQVCRQLWAMAPGVGSTGTKRASWMARYPDSAASVHVTCGEPTVSSVGGVPICCQHGRYGPVDGMDGVGRTPENCGGGR